MKAMGELYVPRRDHRFDSVSEVIAFVEERQCSKGCTMPRWHDDLTPGGSCPIIMNLLLEKPHANLVDSLDGPRCTAYRTAPPQREELPIEWS